MGIVGWQDSDGNLHDGAPSDRDLNRGDVESLRAEVNTPDGPRFTTILGPFPDALDSESIDGWAQGWYDLNYGGGNPAYGSPAPEPGSGPSGPGVDVSGVVGDPLAGPEFED